MSDLIATKVEERILTIRINRPEKKNALLLDMYTAMSEALSHADGDNAIRAICITGTGDVFTSGNDIGDFQRSPPTGSDSPVMVFLNTIARVSKPLLAAVNGVAVGIGTTLLLHCDLVYASPNARFQLPFVNLGLVPEAASSLLLPRMIGHQRAAELLLLGEPFDAGTAANIGLVNGIAPLDDLLEKTLERARALASKPPAAMRLTKGLLKGNQNEVLERIDLEAGHFLERLGSAEAAEALQAFIEKRPPDFSRFD